jgi:hypothetical protein
MNPVQRRRAIYTGLVRAVPEQEVLPILSFWEANYSDKPSFALNDFTVEVIRRSSHKLERASLYRELMGAMHGPVAALLPDPLAQLQVWRDGPGAAASEVSGPANQARETFEALSQALFAGLPGQQLVALKRLVAPSLVRVGVEQELYLRLRNWLEQGSGLPKAPLTLEQLRGLINLLYVGLCELLGPVQADRLLSQAVQQSAGLGLALPPQKLL